MNMDQNPSASEAVAVGRCSGRVSPNPLPLKPLCHICANLDIGLSHFLITNKSTGEGNATKATQTVRSGTTSTLLGSLGHVHSRAESCPLCRLASKTVRQCGQDNVNEETALLLTWELDGRKRDKGDGHMVNRTRRLRLTWKDIDDISQHVYLVMVVAPEKGGYQSSEAYAMSTPDSHFLGRRSLKVKERLALIKSWIDICVGKHATECSRMRGMELGLLNLVNDTYLGVIDVVDMQLKSLPVDGRGVPKPYVALSYVWGNHAKLKVSYITTRRIS